MRLDDTDRVPLIVVTVAQARGHSVNDVYRLDRTATLVRTRHLCWAVSRRLTGFSFPRLSRVFDRDHKTIMSGVRKIEHQIEPLFVAEYETLLASSAAAIGAAEAKVMRLMAWEEC